ncbi:hypothetical protein Tco_1285983, partial [Tanacetum coccineum]
YDSPHSMNSDDTWEPGKDVTSHKVMSVPDAVDAKRPPPVRNCILGLASLRTWQKIVKTDFGIKNANQHVATSQEGTSKGKRKMVWI